MTEGDSWAVDAGRTGDPDRPAPPDVPSEVSKTVGSRHREGKRIILQLHIEHARFARALAPS
jgi:hypothetical protein